MNIGNEGREADADLLLSDPGDPSDYRAAVDEAKLNRLVESRDKALRADDTSAAIRQIEEFARQLIAAVNQLARPCSQLTSMLAFVGSLARPLRRSVGSCCRTACHCSGSHARGKTGTDGSPAGPGGFGSNSYEVDRVDQIVCLNAGFAVVGPDHVSFDEYAFVGANDDFLANRQWEVGL